VFLRALRKAKGTMFMAKDFPILNHPENHRFGIEPTVPATTSVVLHALVITIVNDSGILAHNRIMESKTTLT
jgi:hypothetical protein